MTIWFKVKVVSEDCIVCILTEERGKLIAALLSMHFEVLG
jgi:hypothetical protein